MPVSILFIFKVLIAFMIYIILLYKVFKEFNRLKASMKKYGITKGTQKLDLQPIEVQKQTKRVKIWVYILITATFASVLLIYFTENKYGQM